MASIILKIEIKNVDEWDVNWENEPSKRVAITEVKFDAKNGIAERCGCCYDDVEILDAQFEADAQQTQ